MRPWQRALPWTCAVALLAAACSTEEPVVGEELDAASIEDGGAGRDAAPDAAPPDAALEDAARQDSGPDAGDGGAALLPLGRDDDFGSAELDPAANGEIALHFESPSDAASFVLTADPGPGPRTIELLELRGPDGEVWFDAAAGAEAEQRFEPALRSSLSPYLPFSVMLPSSPAQPFAPGRYELRLRLASGGPLDPVGVDVVFQRRAADDALRPRELSLSLWFVGGAPLDAAAAAEDELMSSALDELAAILSGAGIEVADVQYRDLPDSDAYAALDGDGALAELLALLAAEQDSAPSRALQLVFVDRIASSGKTVRAKTSGLPGPPAHPRLVRRGAVVLAMSELPSSAPAAGELLAHESAHYLGLRHTSEFDGLRHDPIADTPECPADHASAESSDGTPLLTAEDCEELDGRNLLFYTPAVSFRQRELTAGQGYVLAHHPLGR